MAFDFQISEGLIWVNCHGKLTAEDLEQITKLAGELDFQLEPSLDRVIDFTELNEQLDEKINYARIEMHASKRRVSVLKNKVKSAVVAPTLLQYGFARMFQTLNTNPMIEIAIFRDRPSAIGWIKGQAEPKSAE